MNYQIEQPMDLMQKLAILADAAKYDVACTSSGVDRSNDGTGIGNCLKAGICHTFAGDGRCISLLKILMTNECIYDCKYCINRRSNDVPRTTFTPEEICTLTIQFYRRNYIEGLFLSSGVVKSPDFTMELLYQTLYKLSQVLNVSADYFLAGKMYGAEDDEAMRFREEIRSTLDKCSAEQLKGVSQIVRIFEDGTRMK